MDDVSQSDSPTRTVSDLILSEGIAAAIFDLDGTLIDSMPDWEALASDLLRLHGVAFSDELAERIKAMTLRESVEWFASEYDVGSTPESLLAILMERIADRFRQSIPLKPGAGDYVRRLWTCGLRLAVATATEASLAEACLTRLGVRPLFEFILSCETVGIGKTRPDIFLQAAGQLDLEPARILVFEDALHAACTARSAGFYIVGVADPSSAAERTDLMEASDAWIEDFPSALGDLDSLCP